MDPKLVAALRKDPQATRRAFRDTYGGHIPLDMGSERFSELDDSGRERAVLKAWAGN